MGEFLGEGTDNDFGGRFYIIVVGIENQVIVFGVSVVFAEVLRDKFASLMGNFVDSVFGFGAGDVFVSNGSLNSGFFGSGNQDIETLVFVDNKVGSPTQDDGFALMGNGENGAA